MNYSWVYFWKTKPYRTLKRFENETRYSSVTIKNIPEARNFVSLILTKGTGLKNLALILYKPLIESQFFVSANLILEEISFSSFYSFLSS